MGSPGFKPALAAFWPTGVTGRPAAGWPPEVPFSWTQNGHIDNSGFANTLIALSDLPRVDPIHHGGDGDLPINGSASFFDRFGYFYRVFHLWRFCVIPAGLGAFIACQCYQNATRILGSTGRVGVGAHFSSYAGVRGPVHGQYPDQEKWGHRPSGVEDFRVAVCGGEMGSGAGGCA